MLVLLMLILIFAVYKYNNLNKKYNKLTRQCYVHDVDGRFMRFKEK